MSAVDRRHAHRLLIRLLDLPLDERPAALDAACDGNETLRATVVRLLDAADAADSLVDPESGWTDVLWRGLAADAAESETPVAAGARVGPYRVLEEIERGGMAVVYRAERVDGELDRQVAIKVLKLGLDTEEIVRRFEQERQILADLDHPNVARIYDAGRTEEGRPYFVMELVEGVPIDRYCDEHRLTVDERLELFCAVTEAVDYAHRNLVVHRDLKPSNILVSGDGVGAEHVGHGGPTLPAGGGAPRRSVGRVKLLDFGIARLLDVETGGGFAAAPTRALVRMMTPEYASPEQVRGERVTTASDVYQLGVLLYELLTGHRPYALAGRGRGELERAICEQPPTRPSTALTRGSAASRARSASGADVQSAAVDAEATADRDAGPRRGAPPTDAAVEAICHARRTSPARLRRRLRGDLDNIVLKALRKEPERRYRTADRLAQDIRRHLDGLPVTARADTWGYRGRKFLSRHALGATVTAILLVAAAAVAVFHTVRIRNERDRAEAAHNRAQAEATKAEQVSKFLTSMFESADPDNARGTQLTARELLDRGATRVEQELAAQPALQAQMLQVLGRTYNALGVYDAAERTLTRAVELQRRRLPAGDPGEGTALHALGELRYDQGRYEQARKLFEGALRVLERAPERAAPALAGVLSDLGMTYSVLGQLERSRATLERALALQRRVSGRGSAAVTEILSRLSNLSLKVGAFERAERLQERALRIQQRELGADHPEVGHSLQSLANIRVLRGELDAVEALYRRSLAIATQAYGAAHMEVVTVLNNLGNFLILSGRHEEAVAVLRRALEVGVEALGPNHPDTAYPLATLGDAYLAVGDPRAARPFYRRSVAVRRAALEQPGFDPPLFYSLVGVGRTSLELGDEETARRSLEAARELWGLSAGSGGDGTLSWTVEYLGRWLTEQRRCAEAVPLLRRAAELPGRPFDPFATGPDEIDDLLAACSESRPVTAAELN